MPRALSHVTLITAWISGCVCRIGDWAEHSCSETGSIFLPAVDFSQSHLKVSCVCGLLWLSSPLSPTTSHVFSRGLLAWSVLYLRAHLFRASTLFPAWKDRLSSVSQRCLSFLCPSFPLVNGATCCYAQPLLRNSAILCLLFSGLIAGRPNMALFKCFCSCFLASWTFPCIQRELGLEWEPVAPHHGSWLLFSSLWGSCKWGIFLPRVWCLEKEGQLPPQ